jgi:hypothetical protein
VPLSRLQPSQGMNFGRQAEITRDELKFSKFVGRLRKKFSNLFDDLLKTNLVLKGIMSEQDWEAIKEDVYYEFTQDTYTAEAKQAEILRNRVDLLNAVNPYVGSYFSREWVYDKVLHLDEEEIEKMHKELEADTDLQQQMQAQQTGPGNMPAQGPENNMAGPANQPAPYDPSNPRVEQLDINTIKLLKSGA